MVQDARLWPFQPLAQVRQGQGSHALQSPAPQFKENQ